MFRLFWLLPAHLLWAIAKLFKVAKPLWYLVQLLRFLKLFLRPLWPFRKGYKSGEKKELHGIHTQASK
jgi:hypothetical protein